MRISIHDDYFNDEYDNSDEDDCEPATMLGSVCFAPVSMYDIIQISSYTDGN